MIEANVGIGVLRECFAQRHAKVMRLKVVALTDDWAVRDLYICVRPLDRVPKFVRELVELLAVHN
jgi:DNA-binding transcriptional LysR family regulator